MSKSKSHDQAVLAVCAEQPDGVLQSALTADGGPLGDLVEMQERIDVINALLARKRLAMFKQGTPPQFVVKLAQPHENKAKGLSAEEALVHQVIRGAGNTGVWTRDLKVKTNLAQPQVTKILKALEGRGLIKSVKNVNNPSRKLYMLEELEPSREITGGAWYTDQQLDREFIEVLRETCYKLVERSESPHASLGDVAEFINSKGVARVPLREEDIGTIMQTLIADGRIEMIEPEAEGAPERYRPAVLALPEATAFTSVPCGVCPVSDQCTEGGQISPQTCVYFTAWLDDSDAPSRPAALDRRALLLAGGAALAATGRAAAAASAPPAATWDGWSSPGLAAPDDPDLPKFFRTPSGVKVQELTPGSGPAAAPGDAVLVDYVLRRINGYFIYSTVEGVSFQPRDVPTGPVRLRLGGGEVVAGLEEALVGLRPGGKRRVLVPAELGYVSNVLQPAMPTFATKRQLANHASEPLIFEVELLRVLPGGKAA
ncbi:POLR3F [Scenedesmus sp. PABB004]|nr:POLR3F [Scenedesmus sp. PABB004]